MRFTDEVSDRTLVKAMTDGILLAELQRDPDLRRYDTIIIDEAHERTLTIDFLLGYLRRLVERRNDLKVIITSATIDTEKFAAHFAGPSGEPAPIIEVSGRSFPVEVRFQPLGDPDDVDGPILDVPEGIERAARRRGWVWPIMAPTPRPSSRQSFGIWVDLPDPVSPAITTTWLSRIVSRISWRRWVIGSSAGYAISGTLARRCLTRPGCMALNARRETAWLGPTASPWDRGSRLQEGRRGTSTRPSGVSAARKALECQPRDRRPG